LTCPYIGYCRCEARSAAAISVGLWRGIGICVPLHLSPTEIASLRSQRQGMFEIASSLALLAKTEKYTEHCFGLERMLQPTQFPSQLPGDSSVYIFPLKFLKETAPISGMTYRTGWLSPNQDSITITVLSNRMHFQDTT